MQVRFVDHVIIDQPDSPDAGLALRFGDALMGEMSLLALRVHLVVLGVLVAGLFECRELGLHLGPQDPRKRLLWRAYLSPASDKALELLGRQDAELSVVIVNDEQIQDLNRKYLDRDRPTNVISFPQQEGDGPAGEHLGDVVISIETASREAQDSGMNPDERMLQLLVHGICHLVGYNHEGVPDDMARQMEEAEENVCRMILERDA